MGDRKGQKPNIFLESGAKCGVLRGSVACLILCLSSCPLVAGGAGLSRLQDLPEVGSGPLVVRSVPLARSLALCFPAMLANMPLFAILRGFLAGFRGFVWVCSFWVLCVACVVFVRVWS